MSIRDYQTLHLRHQFVIVRKDMNVNEHERLSNFTLKTPICYSKKGYECK